MMLDTSLSCAGLPAVSSAKGHEPGVAPFAIGTMVIEGDSITSGSPSAYSADFYSYRYQDARPDLTIAVRAQGSRSVGQAANLDDNGNTLMATWPRTWPMSRTSSPR